MRRFTMMGLVVILLAAVPVRAADWPRFRGPQGNGISPENGINKDWRNRPPKQLWQVSLTDRGYSGLCVADGKLFVIDHAGSQDVVRALDAATGDEIWRSPYEEGITGDRGFARSTPTFDEGRLYTVSRLGKVCCIDATSGKPVWAVDIIADLGGKRPVFSFVPSPLVVGDKLIVMTGGAQGPVTALNKATGKPLWHGGAGADPAVPPGPIRILPNGQKVNYGPADAPGDTTPFQATIEGRPQVICSS
ncbi:MAG: PQQ-like beta-propeller repeat protein, partial [bacterium]|nr:PQQ-like beta-propeller repeat protein [bacterium]